MVLTYLRLLLKPRNYFFWLNSYANHLLTAIVLCNCHLVVLSYLKLPFEPCSLWLLCSLQTTTHQLGTTRLCSIPAFIKVSLGADSSSLKVVGLHTMVQNTGECVCVLLLKIALLLVKNVFFGVKKSMSELRFYFCLRFRCHFFGRTKF